MRGNKEERRWRGERERERLREERWGRRCGYARKSYRRPRSNCAR